MLRVSLNLENLIWDPERLIVEIGAKWRRCCNRTAQNILMHSQQKSDSIIDVIYGIINSMALSNSRIWISADPKMPMASQDLIFDVKFNRNKKKLANFKPKCDY